VELCNKVDTDRNWSLSANFVYIFYRHDVIYNTYITYNLIVNS